MQIEGKLANTKFRFCLSFQFFVLLHLKNLGGYLENGQQFPLQDCS